MKNFDEKSLKKDLLKLTGNDFAKAEQMARQEGETAVDIITSRTFYAAVASIALKKTLAEIMEMPLKEYTILTGAVGSFLLAPDIDFSTLPAE